MFWLNVNSFLDSRFVVASGPKWHSTLDWVGRAFGLSNDSLFSSCFSSFSLSGCTFFIVSGVLGGDCSTLPLISLYTFTLGTMIWNWKEDVRIPSLRIKTGS